MVNIILEAVMILVITMLEIPVTIQNTALITDRRPVTRHLMVTPIQIVLLTMRLLIEVLILKILNVPIFLILTNGIPILDTLALIIMVMIQHTLTVKIAPKTVGVTRIPSVQMNNVILIVTIPLLDVQTVQLLTIQATS
jgi:hypothetical protein